MGTKRTDIFIQTLIPALLVRGVTVAITHNKQRGSFDLTCSKGDTAVKPRYMLHSIEADDRDASLVAIEQAAEMDQAIDLMVELKESPIKALGDALGIPLNEDGMLDTSDKGETAAAPKPKKVAVKGKFVEPKPKRDAKAIAEKAAATRKRNAATKKRLATMEAKKEAKAAKAEAEPKASGESVLS